MPYEGMIFRPPSEARSLIIQTTVGCSWNKCTFCAMYCGKKFRIKSYNEIFDDVISAKMIYGEPHRVFLADGDALAIDTASLLKILDMLYETFPNLERVSSYASPLSILEKSADDLIELREAGLKMVYLGVETGDDQLLRTVAKGVSAEEMLEAGKKVVRSKIKLSVTILLGLSGRERSEVHARETAKILSEMDPDYIGALTLMVIPGTPMYNRVSEGKMTLLRPKESILECKNMVKDLKVKHTCVFRSNHASNYLPIGGTLPWDKEALIKTMEDVLKNDRKDLLRPEDMRAL
ncbi:MAG: coproporphyrinogen III oxidase [Candidatus Methanolliviera sp. GoM_oil]|nr:MAG: coproporphyrinogen III oxidase [Candidatus Methanolliviera sp. GoM_oil]